MVTPRQHVQRRGPAGRRSSLTRRRWAGRLSGALVGTALVGALLWYVGSLGHAWPVNILVLAVCGAAGFLLTWTVSEHGQRAEVASWYATRREESAPPATLDYRLMWLRRDLRDTVERNDRPDAIYPVLRELALERLQAKHGIDPESDPQSARETMHPDLVGYLAHPPTTTRRQDRRRLETVIQRIEEL